MFCNKCGKVIYDEALVCYYCGCVTPNYIKEKMAEAQEAEAAAKNNVFSAQVEAAAANRKAADYTKELDRVTAESAKYKRLFYAFASASLVLFTLCVTLFILTRQPSNAVPAAAAPPSESEPAPEVVSASPVPDADDSLPLPKNGQVFPTEYRWSAQSLISKITVHAPYDQNVFVKLKRSSTGVTLYQFFVQADSTAIIDIPRAVYNVCFAFGDNWYGVDSLFGDETVCSIDRDINFRRADYEYTLYPIADGNLHLEDYSLEEMLDG